MPPDVFDPEAGVERRPGRVPVAPPPRQLGPSIVVLPIHFVVLSIWAVLGLLFWIPLLFRATAALGVGVLNTALSGTDTAHLSRAFDRVTAFYARGFSIINDVFRSRATPYFASEDDERRKGSWGLLLRETLWVILFWGSLVFLIFRPFPAGDAIPAIQGKLVSARFFESSMSAEPAADDRLYGTEFDSAFVRAIFVDFNFRHPKLGTPVEAPLICRYSGPLGSPTPFEVVASRTLKVDTLSTERGIAFGIGWSERGKWVRGSFRVECQASGHTFFNEQFTIR